MSELIAIPTNEGDHLSAVFSGGESMYEIIQGEKQPYAFTLREKESGDPWDLTGFSDVTVCFQAGAIKVEKKQSLAEVVVDADPKTGKISGDLLVADTASLVETNDGTIEIVVDYGGGDVRKTQLRGGFFVLEKVCD